MMAGMWPGTQAGWISRPGGDGQPRIAELPPGSKAVFYRDAPVHVLRPDGTTFDRGLDGEWSGPRAREGELVVTKLRQWVTKLKLKNADGTTVTLERGEYEVVHDHASGEPAVVSYRQVKGGFGGLGKRLAEPRTFLSSREGGWAETRSPVDSARYEARLASGNMASKAARTLYDIAGRDASLSTSVLKDMLHHGSEDDQMAAIYLAIRDRTGVALRWTQVRAAWDEFGEGKFVNMDAGEGKTWVYLAYAAKQALRDEVDLVHYITTRTNLANRDFGTYADLLTPLGYKVHRMNHQDPPPEAAPGEATIHVGTMHDNAFTQLGGKLLSGQRRDGQTVIHAVVDEADEAFRSRNLFVLSRGTAGRAPSDVADMVGWARRFLTDNLRPGGLSEADFGRGPMRGDGPTALTDEGLAKANEIFRGLKGRMMTGLEVKRLNDAAVAEWGFKAGKHYVVDQEAKAIRIIDHETSDEVLFDPETGIETRWHDGIHQAVEAKEGVPVQADPVSSDQITARQLMGLKEYDQVVGASGTMAGHEDMLAAVRGNAVEIARIPRYYKSLLDRLPDDVLVSHDDLLDSMAIQIKERLTDGTRQPMYVIADNDQVGPLYARVAEKLGVDPLVGHPRLDVADAEWVVKQKNLPRAFAEQMARAGEVGHVLIINKMGNRGADPEPTEDAKDLGGLSVRILDHPELQDVLVQALNRAGRNGDLGDAQVMFSAESKIVQRQLPDNPGVVRTVTKYVDAHDDFTAAREADFADPTAQTHDTLSVAEQRLRDAEQDMRDLIPGLYGDYPHPRGLPWPAGLSGPRSGITTPAAIVTAAPRAPPSRPPPERADAAQDSPATGSEPVAPPVSPPGGSSPALGQSAADRGRPDQVIADRPPGAPPASTALAGDAGAPMSNADFAFWAGRFPHVGPGLPRDERARLFQEAISSKPWLREYAPSANPARLLGGSAESGTVGAGDDAGSSQGSDDGTGFVYVETTGAIAPVAMNDRRAQDLVGASVSRSPSRPAAASAGPVAPDAVTGRFLGRYGRVMAAAPGLDVGAAAVGTLVRGLEGLAGDGHLEEYLDEVFGNQEVTGLLADVALGLPQVPDEVQRTVVSFVNDLLAAAALIPTQEIAHQDRDGTGLADRRSIEPVTVAQLITILRSVASALADGHDPLTWRPQQAGGIRVRQPLVPPSPQARDADASRHWI